MFLHYRHFCQLPLPSRGSMNLRGLSTHKLG
jgi:hypothetical protein